jgi:hypothetical protein
LDIASKAPASKEQATALKGTISLRRTDARMGADQRSAVPVPVVFDLLLVFEFNVVPLKLNGQASRRRRGDLHRSPCGIRRYRDSTVAVFAFQQWAGELFSQSDRARCRAANRVGNDIPGPPVRTGTPFLPNGSRGQSALRPDCGPPEPGPRSQRCRNPRIAGLSSENCRSNRSH